MMNQYTLTDDEKNEIQNHCDKYKMCNGCPFVAGKCVAPVGDHLYGEWLEKMLVAMRGDV